jgi:hypothetical protein
MVPDTFNNVGVLRTTYFDFSPQIKIRLPIPLFSSSYLNVLCIVATLEDTCRNNDLMTWLDEQDMALNHCFVLKCGPQAGLVGHPWYVVSNDVIIVEKLARGGRD